MTLHSQRKKTREKYEAIFKRRKKEENLTSRKVFDGCKGVCDHLAITYSKKVYTENYISISCLDE
jgi:hypothetical protein